MHIVMHPNPKESHGRAYGCWMCHTPHSTVGVLRVHENVLHTRSFKPTASTTNLVGIVTVVVVFNSKSRLRYRAKNKIAGRIVPF